MRLKSEIFLPLFLFACLLPAGAADSSLRHTEADSQALLEQVAHSPFLDRNLRALCDEIGGRMPGTPGMEKAVDWAVQAFREAGVDEVHTESFSIPQSWREGDTRIEVLSPAQFTVTAASTAWVPATPRGGVRAQVLDGGSGSPGQISRLGKEARGKILLVRSEAVTTFWDLADEQRDSTIALREAVEAGAAAVLFIATRPGKLLYRHVNTLDGRLDPIPTALAAREDGLRIQRLLESGKKVEMHFSLPNKVGGPIRSRNVVAEIRGGDQPGEIVIAGAHLDSWDLGTGCLDNAVNVSLVIELARSIRALPRRQRRTVRFILFGGEEEGLLGSRAYARDHRSELDSVVAVIIHDMGVGKIRGYSLGGRKDIEDGLVEAMDPVAGRGANAHSYDAFFGSDHFDFLLEGIPTLIAMQDTANYVPYYHSAADTYEKVDLNALRDAAAIAAVTVFNIADLPHRLGERLSRRQLEELMVRTDLDDQLKFLGLWDEWKEGRRGRDPNGP